MAVLGRGNCTRRGAWTHALRPISLRGVASQLVGGPGAASPSLWGPNWEKIGFCMLAEQ